MTTTDVEEGKQGLSPHGWSSRWFDDLVPARWFPEFARSVIGATPMRVEEFEEDDAIVVKAEMPGLDPDKDLEIDVTDHTLRIRAERRQETKIEEKGRFRSEFRYGSFARTLPLPVGATDKDVKATYKDGILEVRVPVDRTEEAGRKIMVERA